MTNIAEATGSAAAACAAVLLVATWIGCGPSGTKPNNTSNNTNNGSTGTNNTTSLPGGSSFRYVDVAGGLGHTCAIRSDDGGVDCWGLGSRLDMPEGPGGGTLDRDQAVPPGGAFRQIAAGRLFTCAIAQEDDAISCWGGTTGGDVTPPAGAFERIAAGGDTACAIDSSGEIRCWGADEGDLLSPPSGPHQSVAVAETHACAVTEGLDVVCWGAQLAASTPPNDGSFNQISVGADRLNDIAFSCAIATDGTIECWGTGAQNDFNIPPGGRFTSLAVGAQNRCAVSSEGVLQCWGGNIYGMNNAPTDAAKMVAAGYIHHCAIRIDDRIVCWGDNEYGQSTPP